MFTTELHDLYLAYRQAKQAVYGERRGTGLSEFAEYETRLEANLRSLQMRLRSSQRWFDMLHIGTLWLTPKSVIGGAPKTDLKEIGILRTEPPHARKATLEVRTLLSPSVDYLIGEIVYLWNFGHVLDRVLSQDSLGNRLDLKSGPLSRTQRRTFEYWSSAYNRFRSEPVAFAEEMLRRPDRPDCTIVSLDFASYYDSIAPSFLVSPAFIALLAQHSSFDVELYKSATESLLETLDRYRQSLSSLLGAQVTRGIPIGPITSRVIANAFLQPLDALLARHPDVRCYRRYVDDLTIIAERNPDHRSVDDVLRSILPLTPVANSRELDARGLDRDGSQLRLQESKLSVCSLRGPEGLGVVSSVLADMRTLDSERRMFFDPTALRNEALISLARLDSQAVGGLHVLRESDRRQLANLQLHLALQALQQIAVLVDDDEARAIVRRTIGPLVQQFSEGRGWVSRIDLVQRLLRVALLAGDEESARELLRHTDSTWGSVTSLRAHFSTIQWNGYRTQRRGALTRLRDYLHRKRLDAICGALRLRGVAPDLSVTVGTQTLSTDALIELARRLSAADLRVLDREDDVVAQEQRLENDHDGLYRLLVGDRDLETRFTDIEVFVARCRALNNPCWAVSPVTLFACVRPPSYFDVSRRWLAECEHLGFADDVFEVLLRLVNAIRGTRYYAPVANVVGDRTLDVELDGDADVCRVMLANLRTSDGSYQQVLRQNAPNLSYRRLRSLTTLLHKADRTAGSRAKHHFHALLLLPELSLPRQWLRSVAQFAVSRGRFSLVAGLEYQHTPSQGLVYNQAMAVLLGARSSVATWLWTKGYPSQDEGVQIRANGLSFPPVNQELRRTRIQTRAGSFSVLICSELIEARLISQLVMRTEFVLVPSWNMDTATYDHLIQSSSLQMHTAVAIANNSTFSDSRIWAPHAEKWRREVCRLIQRHDNDLIWADLPISDLRDAHASGGAENWKPLPPGPHR